MYETNVKFCKPDKSMAGCILNVIGSSLKITFKRDTPPSVIFLWTHNTIFYKHKIYSYDCQRQEYWILAHTIADYYKIIVWKQRIKRKSQYSLLNSFIFVLRLKMNQIYRTLDTKSTIHVKSQLFRQFYYI